MDIKNIFRHKIMKKLMLFLLGNLVPILLGAITISLVLMGTSFIFDIFKSSDEENITLWAENLTEDEINKILEEGSSINPKNIPEYVELENKGLPNPENPVIREMKAKQTTNNNGSKEVDRWTNEKELDLYSVAYPYRLQWKLVAGLDIIDSKSSVFEFWKKDMIEQADSQLQPIFEWGYDDYSKKVTTGVKYRTIVKKDGKIITNTTKEIITEKEYPLAYLKSVEGTFADYDYIYNEDVITEDTGWVMTNERKSTRKTGGDPIYETIINVDGEEEEVITGKTPVHRYETHTWREEYTIIEEDLLQEVVKTPKLERIGALFDDNDITIEDLISLSAILEQMPNTQGMLENVNDVIGITQLGYTLGNYQSISFNPDIPIIEGDWRREDLIKTADSLAKAGIPYFWGGKYPYKGENPKWGNLTKVTSPGDMTSGTKRPLGLDCSGFVDWVYVQMTGKTIGQGGGTVSQFANTYPVSESNLRLGDLGFYRNGGGVHVGIYAGKHNGHDLFVHAMGEYYSGNKIIWGKVTYSYNNTSVKFKGTPSTNFRYFRRPYIKFKGDPEIEEAKK